MDSRLFEKAWKCVIQEYFTFVCEKSAIEGKCVHVFHFLEDKKATRECNCNYFRSKPGGSAWEDIIENNEENKKLVEKYDPDSMLLICIRIPMHTHTCVTVDKQIKLFYCDTTLEVEDIPTECVDNDSIKSSSKTEGLRKRKL